VKPGKVVTHEQTGIQIRFDRRGRNKLATLRDDLMRVVPAIPEILRKGRYEGPKPETKGRRHILRWHYFVGTVGVAGAPVTVRLAVRELRNGKFLYSLERLEG